jgi:RimJ/RimL family protein N-acetyltransferase
MARRGPELVDGRGAGRVVARLLAYPDPLHLRPVRAEDCRLIWEWANEPATRAASFTTEPIPWEQHRAWFAAKLDDPHCLFFIALDAEGQPIGQVRLDVDGTEAVISVGLAGRYQGLGSGPKVIRQAVRALFASRPAERVVAFIRAENTASYRAFVKAGFVEEGTAAVRGHAACRLVSTRGQEGTRADHRRMADAR